MKKEKKGMGHHSGLGRKKLEPVKVGCQKSLRAFESVSLNVKPISNFFLRIENTIKAVIFLLRIY